MPFNFVKMQEPQYLREQKREIDGLTLEFQILLLSEPLYLRKQVVIYYTISVFGSCFRAEIANHRINNYYLSIINPAASFV